jgi:hypothetical protein
MSNFLNKILNKTFYLKLVLHVDWTVKEDAGQRKMYIANPKKL